MERKTISIGITLLAVIFLVQSAGASGGSGCLTKEAKPYSCKCPGSNQVEHYYGNEDLKAAMENKNSCCYKAKHYVRPEVMLNPKIGDWVQLNETWFKLVGISAKSYRGANNTDEVITTKTVLVPYNETNEYIEWNKMYPPEEPILFGPCESTDNETVINVTQTTQTIDLIFTKVSVTDFVRTLNYLMQ